MSQSCKVRHDEWQCSATCVLEHATLQLKCSTHWKSWCASPIPGINISLVENFQKMNTVSVPWSHPRTTRQASVKNALQSEKCPHGFFCCCCCCPAKWNANYALNVSGKKNLPLITCLIHFHQNVILSGWVLFGTYQKPLLSVLIPTLDSFL